MSDSKPIVVVVGITGMFGSKIVDELLKRNEAKVRATVRDFSKVWKVQEYINRGVEIVEADITKPETLDKALAGAKAVISAVNNDPSLIIDGQTNLLRAAERNNVQRFIPSDYAIDYHPLDYGDNYNLDMRKDFFKIMEASSVPYTSVLQGAFTEMLLSPFFSPYNKETGEVNYYGDGEQLVDFTTVQDTAKYVAAVVLDPRFANRTVRVVGEAIGYKDLAVVIGKLKGIEIVGKSIGTTDDLWNWIVEKKQTAATPWEYLGQQYQWNCLSGKAKLYNLDNDLFPDIVPTTIEEFLTGKV